MKIGIDMMGGDFAPLEAVKGIQQFLQQPLQTIQIICIGDETVMQPMLQQYGILDAVQIIHAPERIGYNEHPTKALKEKQKSSIAVGFHLLATGAIDAFASAGNTGAMLVGAMFSIKPIKGVARPTIATIIPKINGDTGLLLDVGLNSDCKPEHLNQFALLGKLYAQNILNIAEPKIGLMNVGEEEAKGNILMQAAHPLLKQNAHLNFIGNIEGRDLFNGKADVMVCDGFTGNIILKLAESFYDIAVKRNVHNDEYFSRFHYQNYGGTPVLGIAKPVVIGHGISNAVAFKNMLSIAQKMVETDLCAKMVEQFEEEK